MVFELTILGSNAAIPAHNRHPTAQFLQIDQHCFLIDCGEGTQMQMSKFKIRPNRIHHIFISHLHGDHYLGLMGLISTMHLYQRTEDLHLYGPVGLSEILTAQLKYSDTRLSYPLHFREVDTEARQLIFENEILTVETIPLRHRIRCAGFLFREKPKKRRLRKEVLPADISLAHIAALKKGLDVKDAQGNVVMENEAYTLPPRKSRSYAYCSDTRYHEELVAQIRNVDLLYHESTFLDEEAGRASETFHSTARQAAAIARMAGVERLLLGHYSSRYKDLNPFLEEARCVFEASVLSVEGESVVVPEE
ncbi:MAG: ribonuclease Z [Ferruginibacter sp.]|nr:ribonuclease Z [Cytophagales bacterium]